MGKDRGSPNGQAGGEMSAVLKARASRLGLIILLLMTSLSSLIPAGVFVVYGPKTFTKGTSTTQTFAVSNPKIAYTLQIDNSGVTDAKITLNGTKIVGDDD